MRPLVLERMSRFEQFVDHNSFFFNGELNYAGLEIVPKGKTPEDLASMLKPLVDKLDELYDWTVDNLHATLDSLKNELGWKPKDFFMPIRLIVTGRKDSPPLTETLQVLGREMVRFRIRDYLNKH
jgi:glutamyl-tRNA synthetase